MPRQVFLNAERQRGAIGTPMTRVTPLAARPATRPGNGRQLRMPMATGTSGPSRQLNASPCDGDPVSGERPPTPGSCAASRRHSSNGDRHTHQTQVLRHLTRDAGVPWAINRTGSHGGRWSGAGGRAKPGSPGPEPRSLLLSRLFVHVTGDGPRARRVSSQDAARG